MQEKTKYIIWFKEIYRRGAEVINFRKFFSASPRLRGSKLILIQYVRNQTIGQFRLKPGRLWRHHFICISHSHQGFHTGWI
jgi:hypothetical protein